MNIEATQPPFFHLLIGSTTDLGTYHAKLRIKEEAGLVIRLLRGEDMTTWRSLFAEMAAALQLPLYFGRNMNALAECLADLGDWLPARGYVLVVSETLAVLREECGEDFAAFFRLLADVAREWAAGTLPGANWERKPTPFHIILHVDAGGSDTLAGVLKPVLGVIPTV